MIANLPVDADARSYAATHGAAPFDTPDLLPGDPLDLTRVDLSQPGRQVAALTFDDGPDPNDANILAILARYKIHATFFTIGEKVAGGARSLQAAAAAGHEIGNHTFKHPMMTDMRPAEQRRNLLDANAALARIGITPTWFRPPFGDYDDAVVAEAKAAGLHTVVWTLDSRDWKNTAETDAIAERVGRLIKAGSVVLMHSTQPVSTRALPRIIEAGLAKGLRFVTLSQWRQAMSEPPPAR